MIEQGRTDGLVPSKTEVVGEARLEKVRVEGRREARVSIQLLLVPAAIGEEEFIGVSPVLVNPESHGRISNRVSGDKDKVVPQRISSIWIRVNRQEGKNILCDRADASDLELANGFNRGSVFIKSWTKLGVSNTRAIEYDFSTQILAAGNFGFENTRRGRVAERSWTNSAGS